jgi:hypothetical protein
VSDEVQKLYKITMKASQDVPGLLKSLGDKAKEVGETICE